ncbi:MAG: peptidase M23, partial [Gammaproteobacteria bacterium]
MRLILTVLLILTLAACGGGHAVAPVGDKSKSKSTKSTKSVKTQKPPSVYKVKKGDTLYSISWRYGMDYKQLGKMNGIRSPYTIYVGQKIYFKPKSTTSKTKTAKTTTTKKTTSAPKNSNKSTTTAKPKSTTPPKQVEKPKLTKAPAPSANKKLSWRWPTSGPVLSTYSKSETGRKGIDIAGKAGQPIISAAAGKVVYSGDGLPRYGNLLIIKHNDAYLSAYAHNDKLLVKEGQHVNGGQKIATLGRSGAER